MYKSSLRLGIFRKEEQILTTKQMSRTNALSQIFLFNYKFNTVELLLCVCLHVPVLRLHPSSRSSKAHCSLNTSLVQSFLISWFLRNVLIAKNHIKCGEN